MHLSRGSTPHGPIHPSPPPAGGAPGVRPRRQRRAAATTTNPTPRTTAPSRPATPVTTGARSPAAGASSPRCATGATLNCGVNNAVPGFGVVDDAGEFSGFDIDFCQVIAAAVLGDAEAVEFVPLTAEQRFTSLQSGEIDVLVRNTTRTASRDGTENAALRDHDVLRRPGDDGHRRTRASRALDDMDGTTVCVLSGTTTEQNLATVFNARGLASTPLTFDEPDQIREAILQGQCDGWTSDRSQLAGLRSAWPEAEGGPEGLVIFDDIISKEPLGPARAGRRRRLARRRELGGDRRRSWPRSSAITSENVDEQLESDDPDGPDVPRAAHRRGQHGRRPRPRPRAGLRGHGDPRGRQLRRDLRAQRRSRHRRSASSVG